LHAPESSEVPPLLLPLELPLLEPLLLPLLLPDELPLLLPLPLPLPPPSLVEFDVGVLLLHAAAPHPPSTITAVPNKAIVRIFIGLLQALSAIRALRL
jgi:hypothetical protein